MFTQEPEQYNLMAIIFIIIRTWKKPTFPLAKEWINVSQVWWFMSIKPTLRKWRQKDHVFEISLGYITRPSFKTKQKYKQIKIPSNKTSEKMLCYMQIIGYLEVLDQKKTIKSQGQTWIT